MQYDIIIIGGGMVGATLASLLGDTPLRVALIDAAGFSAQADQRLIALNYNNFSLLKNINPDSTLLEHAAPIKKIHVSHRGHFGSTILSAKEINLNELGYVVPAKHINTMLYEKIDKLSNVRLIRPATVTGVVQDGDVASVVVSYHPHPNPLPQAGEGEMREPQAGEGGILNLECQIIVAADGTHSTVRDLLNIATDEFDYQQKAIVTISELKREHNNIAYERFLKTGAVAMLPLTGKRAATIWTDNENIINKLMAMDDESYTAELQKQFGYHLGRICHIQQRFVYPLKLIKVKQQINQRTILIGNAAHTIHPIAAQGLNLAFNEIHELTEYLKNQNPDHLTLPSELCSKQQERTISLSHRLSWLFSTDFFALNLSRQIGMMGLDNVNFLKTQFVKKTMGLQKSMNYML